MPRPPARPDGADSVVDAEIASYVSRAGAASRALADMPALSAFQRRMDAFEQLSPEAQNELAADYQAGLEARRELDSYGTKRVPVRVKRRCQDVIARGDWAGEQLIGSNFRLLRLICRENAEERFGKERANSMLPDLIAEANIALVEAANNFDATRGPSFPTYAARVVRDRVRMMISREGPLRLAPSWVRIKRIAAVRMPALEGQLGRPATMEELRADLLAVCLEWAERKLTDAQRAQPPGKRRELMMSKLRKQGMLGALDNLEDVLIATQGVASLDAPAGSEGSSSMGELLSGDDEDDVTAGVERAELRAHLMDALASLPERERQILLYRYGFVDGEVWTFAKIAEEYGVTAERIRQIERHALEKLGSPHGFGDGLGSHLPGQFDN